MKEIAMATRANKPVPLEPVPFEDEEERPEWWDWNEDGNVCAGEFVRAGSGFTKLGSKQTFIVLKVAGVERTVWLHWEALRGQLRQRYEQCGPLAAGERMVIRRNPNKRTSGDGFDYFDFKVVFPDDPEPDQADLFGVRKAPAEGDESEANEEPSAEGDDSIPF
jgi:hypothetical protein